MALSPPQVKIHQKREWKATWPEILNIKSGDKTNSQTTGFWYHQESTGLCSIQQNTLLEKSPWYIKYYDNSNITFGMFPRSCTCFLWSFSFCPIDTNINTKLSLNIGKYSPGSILCSREVVENAFICYCWFRAHHARFLFKKEKFPLCVCYKCF